MEENNTLNLGKIAEEQKRNIKRKEKEETQGKIAKQKRAKKRKFYAITTSLFILIVAVYWFACNYYIQVPFTVGVAGRPLIVKRVKPEIEIINPVANTQENKVLTDMEIIEQYKFKVVLKSIYMLESTQGKNDACKDQGLFNGYGFRQNTRESKCYTSFEQVTERVNEWLEERLSYNGNDLIEALCYYNTGIANQNTCTYAQNFMSVLVDNL